MEVINAIALGPIELAGNQSPAANALYCQTKHQTITHQAQ